MTTGSTSRTPRSTWEVAARTYRIVVVVGLAVVALVAMLTLTVGIAPWTFLALGGLVGLVVLAPTLGVNLATWMLVAGALFVAQWVMVVNAGTGLRLDVAVVAALTAALVAAAAFVLRRLDRVVHVPRPRLVDTAAVLGPAVLSGAVVLVGALLRGQTAVTWAMAGDAQLNTVLARLIALDGGATPSNSNVISLAQGLMAMVHLPGRDAVPGDDRLLHDLVRQADLWVLLVLVASVLGGAIAAHVLRRAHAVVRVVGILGAAAIPLSWHLTGYAMTAGFYNADLAYLALELVVFFWLALRSRPWLRASVLVAMTTVLLGSWTPLAIIPMVLAAAAGVVALRTRPRVREVVLVAVAALQVVAFGILFIVPAYLRTGAELSQQGTIVPIPLPLVLAVAAGVVALAAALLRRTDSARRSLAAGSLLFLGGSAIGIGFLYFQNRHLDEPWIYYPIKFGWLALEVMFLLIWLAAAVLVREAGRTELRASVAMLLATGLAIVGLSALNPPRYGGVLSYLPLVEIALETPTAEDSVDVLSEHAGERVMFSRYLGADDAFLNQWQFQLSIRDADEPIRAFAYRVVETPADFCDAAAAWGGDVEVLTADEAWADRLNDRCGDVLDAVTEQPPTD